VKIGIVADDLTGAADSVAPFAARGLRCAVANLSTPESLLADFDVTAVSTETRDMPFSCPDTVHSAIARAVLTLNGVGPPQILCKKIDSALRGHVDVELKAICAHAPERTPVICPAFPAQGRTVAGGVLFVRGEPRRRVIEVLDGGTHWHYVTLDLADIRRGTEWVCRWLGEKSGGLAPAVLFDAETERDLEIVAAAVLQNPSGWLPVGSAGFMRAIASQMRATVVEDPLYARARESLRGEPLIVICGSRSNLCRRQIIALERASSTLRTSSAGEAIDLIGGGFRIAIAASPEDEQDRDIVLEKLLGGIERLEELPSATLIVTGGATAAAMLRRCDGFTHLIVVGEIEPGIVATLAVFKSSGNKRATAVHLLLKAGDFGGEATLARIAGL